MNSNPSLSSAHSPIPLLPFILSILGLSLLFVTTAVGGTHALLETLWWLLAVVGAYFLWRLLARANEWTRNYDFFAPGVAFVSMYLLWFALGSWNVVDLPERISFGAFVPIPMSQWTYYALGLAGYGLGLLLGRARIRTRHSGTQFHATWEPQRFWTLVALLIVGMLCSLVIQVSLFGVPGFSASAGEERLAIRGIPHFVFISCSFTLLVVLSAYLWSTETSKRARFLAGGLLFFTVLALPFLQGGRGDLMVSLLTLLLMHHYMKKQSTLFSLLGLGATGIVGLSLIGYLRDYSLTSGDSMGWLEMIGLPNWMLPALYALLYVRFTVSTFRDVTATIPHSVAFQHGAVSLSALTTILPGHHDMSDMFFKTMLGNEFVGGGQPATLLGPLYADFGAFGIVAGMVLFGFIISKAYNTMLSRRTPFSAILYAWVLQTGLLGLFGSLFTYITTLSLPLMWFAFDLLARPRATSPDILKRERDL